MDIKVIQFHLFLQVKNIIIFFFFAISLHKYSLFVLYNITVILQYLFIHCIPNIFWTWFSLLFHFFSEHNYWNWTAFWHHWSQYCSEYPIILFQQLYLLSALTTLSVIGSAHNQSALKNSNTALIASKSVCNEFSGTPGSHSHAEWQVDCLLPKGHLSQSALSIALHGPDSTTFPTGWLWRWVFSSGF